MGKEVGCGSEQHLDLYLLVAEITNGALVL